MRIRVGIAIGLVAAAGLAARALQTHHDTVHRLLARFRRGDLTETGAVKLRAVADLGSERLRVAVADARHNDQVPTPSP